MRGHLIGRMRHSECRQLGSNPSPATLLTGFPLLAGQAEPSNPRSTCPARGENRGWATLILTKARDRPNKRGFLLQSKSKNTCQEVF